MRPQVIGMKSGYLGPTADITTGLCLLILAGNSTIGSGSQLASPAVTQQFRPFSFQIWTLLVPPPRDTQNILSGRAVSRLPRCSSGVTTLWLFKIKAQCYDLRITVAVTQVIYYFYVAVLTFFWKYI